jgi:hypothetical protein
MNDSAVSSLEKMSKGDEVVVYYEKKGTSRYVSKLVSADAKKEEEVEESSAEFKCEVCGKELKDGKFKKCYMCNKSGATNKKEYLPEEKPYVKQEYKSNYGTPEDVAGKEIGCALNAAATAASGCGFNVPEDAAQFVRELASNLLDWIRENK